MSSDLLTRERAGVDARGPGGPMDPRLRARRIEVARDHGRKRLRRLAALAVVTAVVLAGLGLTRSTLLDVDTVTITGAGRTGTAEARAAAGIPTGRAMTAVDPAAAVARLEALPWVAEASVTKRWPGTVAIELRERTPVAVVGEGAGAVLVDRQGRILGPAVAGDRLPTAGPDPVAGVGERIPPARRAILPVLADLPAALRAEVERGTVGPSGLGLVLRDGITVHLGDATRLRAKADAVLVLLDLPDRATMATIDVAVPDAAAVTDRRPPLTPAEAGGA